MTYYSYLQDLENQADGTVDYRRLNQELSVTANTMSPEGAAKTAATLAALQDIEDEEDYENERRPGAPIPLDHVQSERVNIHLYAIIGMKEDLVHLCL